MKKLVNYRMMLSVNGGEWRDTSIFNHIRYLEESECETWESRELNFNEALELVEEGFIMNAECDQTFFTHRPRIQLSISESIFEGPSYYTERTLATLKIKKEYRPYNGSIKDIAILLSAEQFCEYLKDHGIVYCPSMVK